MAHEAEQRIYGAAAIPADDSGADLHAAREDFSAHLEQLAAYRRHLTGQAEVLRREGVKLAQRQRAVAAEEARVRATQAALSAERDTLAVAHANIAAARAEIAQQTAFLSQQRAEHALAAADLTAAWTMLEQAQAANAERQRHQASADHSELAATARALETALADADTRAANLLAERTALADERTRLAAQLAAIQTQCTQLEAARAAAERTAGQARQETSDLRAAHAQAAAVGTQLREDLATLQTTLTAARAELATQQASWQREREAVAADRAAERTRVAQRVAELERALSEARDALAAARMQAERREIVTNRKADEEIGRLQARIAELEAEQQTLVGRCGALQQDADRIQAALDRETAARAELARQAAVQAATHAAEAARNARPIVDAAVRRQRERLVRQARMMRAKVRDVVAQRQQSHGLRAHLEAEHTELTQHQAQVAARQAHLDRVTRLLEKQELVMARKIADHSALKTVAAVGIFVVLVLGLTFLGVYKFVSPVYRTEAVVQLTPPADLPRQQAPLWLNRQAETIRTDLDVLHTAWARMRADGYAMHEARDVWLEALPRDLEVKLDPTTRTLAVRVTGAHAEGVATAANALAVAYTEKLQKLAVESKPGSVGSAIVSAKATVPVVAVRDQRTRLALSVTASVMFVSLIAVMLLRRKIVRELRAIDRMADEEDLAGMGDELAVE